MLILATKATGYDFQNPLLSFFGIMIQIQNKLLTRRSAFQVGVLIIFVPTGCCSLVIFIMVAQPLCNIIVEKPQRKSPQAFLDVQIGWLGFAYSLLELVIVHVVFCGIHLCESGKFVVVFDRPVTLDTFGFESIQAQGVTGDEKDIGFPFRVMAVGMILCPFRNCLQTGILIKSDYFIYLQPAPDLMEPLAFFVINSLAFFIDNVIEPTKEQEDISWFYTSLFVAQYTGSSFICSKKAFQPFMRALNPLFFWMESS